MDTPYLGVIFLMVIAIQSSTGEDTRRPFYNIAHMTNKRATVDKMLNEGANALEADLKFDSTTGKADMFYHGVTCDCFRVCTESEAPTSLLGYITDICTPGHPSYNKKFSGLLWIDLKLSNIDTSKLEQSGKDFAHLLINTFKIKASNNLKILLGIWNPGEFLFIKGCVEELRRLNQAYVLSRIAVSGTQTHYFQQYIAANKQLGLPPMWLDEGIANCWAATFKLTEFKEAVRLRDDGSDVSKVSRWTVDTKDYMRNALSVGADSIITNDPDDLLEVLHEPDYVGKFRLATADDNPFKKIQGHGPYRLDCYYRRKWYTPWTGTYQCWKDTNFSGSSWCYTDRYCGNARSSCEITDKCE